MSLDGAGGRTSVVAELADASTTSLRLAHIAQEHPELAGTIAGHPNAYPELIDWARAVGGVSAPIVVLRSPRWARVAWITAAVLLTVPLLIFGVISLLDQSMFYMWVAGGLPGMIEFGWGWRIDALQVPHILGYLAALVGAFGAPTVGRRVGAIVTWAAAAAIPVIAPLIGFYSEVPTTPLSPITTGWVSLPGVLVGFVVGVLMLTAWILSWPLRSAAFATVAVFFVGVAVEYLVGYAFYGNPLFLLLTSLIVPALVVFLALVFSRAASRRAGVSGVTASGIVASGGASSGGVYGATGTASRTNTMAILSLVFAFLVSILAVVFGHVALGQIRRTGEDGRGFAIAGLVLGYVGIAVWTIGLIVWFVLFSTFVRGY